MSMEKVAFPKRVDEVSINLNIPSNYNAKAVKGIQGVLSEYGWTVTIGADEIKHYLAEFARNPLGGFNNGFHLDGERFVVSYGSAKMTLNAEQGAKVIGFLTQHFSQGS